MIGEGIVPFALALAFYFAIVAVVSKRWITMVVGLLLISIAAGIIAGVDLETILTVIQTGPVQYTNAILAAVAGAWLSVVVVETGIAQDYIRRAVELGGGRPLPLTLSILLVSAFLWTTLWGIGAWIMIGSITIPIMLATGISPVVAAHLFSCSIFIGGAFRLAGWPAQIRTYGITMDLLWRNAPMQSAFALLISLVYIFYWFRKQKISMFDGGNPGDKKVKTELAKKVPIYSLLTPALPLILVGVFKYPIIPAFIVAVIYGCLTTIEKREDFRQHIELIGRSLLSGIPIAASSIAIYIGLGWIRTMFRTAAAVAAFTPFWEAVLPKGLWGLIAFFAVLAPLHLFRGPFSGTGMGVGIAAVFTTAGLLTGQQTWALFQGSALMSNLDPTHTHRVWAAEHAKTDSIETLKSAIFLYWPFGIIKTIIWALVFF